MKEIRGLVQGIRVMTLTVLIMLTLYLLLDNSGMLLDFQFTPIQPQIEITYEPIQTEIARFTIVNVSFLKDPTTKEQNVYRGAMKKSALDRMKLIRSETLEFSDKESISDKIAERAHKLGANVIIIDNKMELYRQVRKEK